MSAHQRFFFHNGNIMKFCKVTDKMCGWGFPPLIIFHITLQSFKRMIKVHLKYLSPDYISYSLLRMLATMGIKPRLVFFFL